MHSGQRNVDKIKYTIANITMNIIVSLVSQAARMAPSSIRRGWRQECKLKQGDLNTLVNQGIAQ